MSKWDNFHHFHPDRILNRFEAKCTKGKTHKWSQQRSYGTGTLHLGVLKPKIAVLLLKCKNFCSATVLEQTGIQLQHLYNVDLKMSALQQKDYL